MLDVATLVARVVADTSGFQAGMARTQSTLTATAERMKSTGRAMTMGLTVPILAIAGESVKMAMGFQQQMEMIHTQAGAAQKNVDLLTKSVLALSPATRYGPEELAKALYHIESVSSGAINNAQAMNVLKVAAEGAAVGNANLEDTASALMGTMRVFHEPASHAAQVMGELNAIVGAGNMRMQDLNAAIATGIMPTARALGLGIKDVGAGLALMTDESTHASVAATRMRTAMLMATGETEKSRKALAGIGIGALDLAHAMNKPDGLVLAMADLNKHLETIPDKAKRAQIVAQIFGGARSSGTILQFLNNLDMMQQKYDQISRTAKNFPEDVMKTQATDAFKWHEALAGVQTVMTQMGGILAPIVVKLAQDLSKMLQGFSKLSPEMQKIIVFGGLIVAAIGPALWIIGSLITAVEALAGAFAALISIPGAVVAALAGIAIGFYELYQHSEEFRNAVHHLVSTFTSEFHPAVNALGNLFDSLKGAFSGLGVTWGEVGSKMSSVLNVISSAARTVIQFVIQQFNSMAEGIKAHTAEIQAFLRAAWNDIAAVTRAVWPIIATIIRTVWDAIKIIIQTAMRVIGNVILAVMDIISGNWSGAWNAIKSATNALLSGIVHLIETLLRGAISVVAQLAELIGKAIWNGIKAGAAALAGLAAHLISMIGKAIADAASWAGHAAAHIGSSIVHGILGGVTSLPGALAGKLHSAISSAISFAGGLLHGSGPFQFTIHAVGEPMAEGIIQGLMQGLHGKLSKDAAAKIKEEITAVAGNAAEIQHAATILGHAATQGIIDGVIGKQESLKQQLQTSLRQAITQAIQTAKTNAQSQMSTLMSSFGSTSNSILSAFNAQTSGHVTDAQKQLTQMQAEDQIKQYQDAVNQGKTGLDQANKDLADALSGGDPKKIDEARKAQSDANDAYNKALRDQQEFNLSQLSIQQQQQWETDRTNQEEALAKQLVTLQNALAKHPEEYRKLNRQILAIMAQNNIPMFQAGQQFIDELAGGLTKQIPELEKAAKAAAKAMSKYLKLRSPAEAGPLSDLDTWWAAFTPTILKGFDTSGLARAVTGALRPAQVAVGMNTPAGGSLTQTGARDASAPLVAIDQVHVHNDTDVEVLATTLGRQILSRT